MPVLQPGHCQNAQAAQDQAWQNDFGPITMRQPVTERTDRMFQMPHLFAKTGDQAGPAGKAADQFLGPFGFHCRIRPGCGDFQVSEQLVGGSIAKRGNLEIQHRGDSSQLL